MKDLFISFLKEQNIYDDFVEKFSEEYSIEKYLHEFTYEPKYYIIGAFSWRSEYKFWHEVSLKWINLLKQQENEKNN